MVDVSGVRVSPTGGSLPIPDGAYALLPVWSTCEQWLAAVRVAMASPEGVALRRAWRDRWVSDERFWAIVHAMASFADHRTGRGGTAAKATIAARAGLLPKGIDRSTPEGRRRVAAASKQVQLTRAILEHFGLCHIVGIGRISAKREVAAYRAVGIAGVSTGNELALTVPAHLARQVPQDAATDPAAGRTPAARNRRHTRATFHLPSDLKDPRTSPVTETPTKPRSRPSDAARPGQRKSSPRRQTPRPLTVPLAVRPPAFRRLVARLDAAVVSPDGRVTGRFTQGRSVLGLVRVLDEFGIDASWTADELLERIIRWSPDRTLHNGLGWLRTVFARMFRHEQPPVRDGSVPPAPPEFRGHADLEHLWATDDTFRDGWYRLQTLHAAEEAATTPTGGATGTNGAGAPDRAADSHTAPHEATGRARPVPEWQRELAAAQARIDAEDDAARAAAIAAARNAGRNTAATRPRVPYVPVASSL